MRKSDHQLVQRILDGEVDGAGFDAFQQRLRAEPELMELYRQYSLLHHSLAEEHEGGFSPGGDVSPHRYRMPRRRVWVAAALVVLTAAAVWQSRWWWLRMDSPDVAVVTFSLDAVARIEGVARNLGSAAGVGEGARIFLDQGRAEIAIDPVVSGIVEGPAEWSFGPFGEIRLAHGRAWFDAGTGGAVTLITPWMSTRATEARFGILAGGERDETHVAVGTAVVAAANGPGGRTMQPGSAVAVAVDRTVTRIEPRTDVFARGLGRFHVVFGDDFGRDAWRVEYGNPVFSAGGIGGGNFAAHHLFGSLLPADGDTIVLTTLEVGNPRGAEFHTDGWAGMSFYSGGEEVLFFGDSFGARESWSLDVKQRVPVILPEVPVVGPRTVTLRYDMTTGDVSLHDGAPPLSPAFCVGRIPAGTRFEEIRLGASAGAAFTVNGLQIRTGGR